MGISLYIMIVSIGLFSLLIISKAMYYRKKISCMTGMMIAMTLGMIVGLTIGVIFGVLFSGDFFLATVLGVLVGMVVGFMAGVPISIMATLDGMLSGVMGGMMGAMLGEIIATPYEDAIVKIMFFLLLGTLFIALRLINEKVKRPSTIFHHPFTSLVVFGLFFILFELFGPVFR